MNVPSKILVDAIEFALNHHQVRPWIEIRDLSQSMTVKSIRSEIVNVVMATKTLLIKISIDYLENIPEVSMIEDIIIDLAWRNNNYTLVRVRPAREA